MGGAWKGPPRRGGTSARRRGGFLRSARYPARVWESAPLPPPSRPGAQSSARGAGAILPASARTDRRPHPPPALSSEAHRAEAFRSEGGSGRGPGPPGPIAAPGSDGRRREEPGMLRLMANCCSWFQRRQEPVR